MRSWWQWGLGIGGLLLAHSASAEQANAAAPVSDALPVERGAAPVSAPSGTPEPPPTPTPSEPPKAPPTTTWSEPPEPPAAPPPAPKPREHWYGWQILMSDAASLTLAVATSQSWLFAPGYLVAPPLIHVFHGQGMRALASAGMRIGLPFLGYAIAVEGSHSCSGSDIGTCDVGMVFLGFLVGISAMGIDPAFAYEPVEPAEHPRTGFAPQILVTGREARFGLVGSF